jgi:hypothetical protein
MADDNRFFRLLGRVNAVLFFLACCAVLLAVGIMFAGEPLLRPSGAPYAAVETAGGDTYEFGGNLNLDSDFSTLTRLEGTEEGFLVLQRDSGGYKHRVSLSRDRGETDNVDVLLFDLRTMQSRWMFRGTGQDIQRAYRIREVFPAPEKGVDPVTALLMPVAAKDTNGDGKINSNDAHALYLYRPGTARAVKLLDAVLVNDVEQIDSGRVLVLYSDGKADHAAMLSAKDFSVIAQAAVSPNPH